MNRLFDQTGLEPTLDEILGDPMVRLIMQRDGVAQDEVDGLIERVRAGLRRVAAAATAA